MTLCGPSEESASCSDIERKGKPWIHDFKDVP